MRAVVLREHGDFDKLTYVADFPDPPLGPATCWCGCARPRSTITTSTLRGMPGIKVPMPAIMGLDIAGEIVALGPEVKGWAIGDRVLVDPVNLVEGA